jgi:hypothetical protein
MYDKFVLNKYEKKPKTEHKDLELLLNITVFSRKAI